MRMMQSPVRKSVRIAKRREDAVRLSNDTTSRFSQKSRVKSKNGQGERTSYCNDDNIKKSDRETQKSSSSLKSVKHITAPDSDCLKENDLMNSTKGNFVSLEEDPASTIKSDNSIHSQISTCSALESVTKLERLKSSESDCMAEGGQTENLKHDHDDQQFSEKTEGGPVKTSESNSQEEKSRLSDNLSSGTQSTPTSTGVRCKKSTKKRGRPRKSLIPVEDVSGPHACEDGDQSTQKEEFLVDFLALKKQRAHSPENEMMRFFVYNKSNSEDLNDEPHCRVIERCNTSKGDCNTPAAERTVLNDGIEELCEAQNMTLKLKGNSRTCEEEMEKQTLTDSLEEDQKTLTAKAPQQNPRKSEHSEKNHKPTSSSSSSSDISEIKTEKQENNCRLHSSDRKKESKGKSNIDNLARTKTQYSCSECAYVAKEIHNLNAHFARLHAHKPYKCRMCDGVFGLKSDLNKHMRRHLERHMCSLCGKVYKERRVLLEHMQIHGEDYTKPMVQCPYCKKCLCNKYVAKQHILIFHEGQKASYPCSECDKQFTSMQMLREHMNLHKGIRPFVCKVCQKTFAYRKSLMGHMNVHSETPKFSCHICGKGFKQRSALNAHFNSHKEESERPYVCDVCQKRFTQKQALVRHKRIHDGVKPYSCSFCSRQFSDSSVLRRHLFTHNKKLKPQKNTVRQAKSKSHSSVTETVTRQTDSHISAENDFNQCLTEVTETEDCKVGSGSKSQGVDLCPVAVVRNMTDSDEKMNTDLVNEIINYEPEQSSRPKEMVLVCHNPDNNQAQEIIVYVEEGVKMSEDELVKGALLASGISL